MKKNWLSDALDPGILKKTKRVMRILFVLVFGFSTLASAKSYSQATRLDVQMKNQTVLQVINYLENNSEFVFLYKPEEVNLDKKVDLNLQDATIHEIMDQTFIGEDISCDIYERQVVIRKTEKLHGIQQATKKVTGIVIDNKGEAVPGVTVMVPGTTTGTVTDMDGKFQLEISETTETLQFSFIGMKTLEIPVEGKSTFTISMAAGAIGLEEIVVVGYGTQKKKDLTGSVSIIKSDKLVDNSPVDILDGMQGKIAGVKISSNSGEPGAGVNISIRGFSSISAGTSPLFIIDGMPYDVNPGEVASASIGNGGGSNPLSNINPADIETMTVLKDASSTAIYGARGANGVIIITTKSGKSGQSLINFSSTAGFSQSSKEYDVLSGNEFIEYRRDVDPEGYLFFSSGDLNKPIDPYVLLQRNWQDELLRTAFQQNYDLSLSGKSDKTTYSVSLGYLDNNAIVINNDQQRYSMRMKVDHQKSEKLLIGLTTSASYSEINGASHGGGGNGLFSGIVQSLVTSTPVEIYNPTFDPGGEYISPMSMVIDTYKKIATFANNTAAFLNYTIVDGLTIKLTGGGAFSTSKGTEFYGKDTNWGVLDKGYSNLSESRAYSMDGSAQLHYSKYFNENHNLKAMIGAETNRYNYEWFGVTKTDFLDESTGAFDISKGSVAKNSSSFRDHSQRLSFFGRLNYIFKEKHILTATFRADGSDKFGANNKYGYFPSAGYSWILTEEDFMKNQTVASMVKLRVSYGASGNDRIPSHRYLARLENTYYNGELGMAPSSQANDNLQWETTYQSNIGLDLGFLQDAITLTVDVYDKQTHDMLIPTPTAGRTGYREQWQNIGRVDNQGIEFQLSTQNFNKKDFKWTTDFNISHNKNTIVDLGLVDFIPVNMPGAWIQDVGRVVVGGSLGEAFGYVTDGIYQIGDFNWQEGSNPDIPHEDRMYVLNDNVVSIDGLNVKPGSHKFADQNADGTIKLDDDRKAISSSQPLFFGGIGNTFKYKNFDINVFFEGSYGNEIFNESKFRLEGGIIHGYMNVTKEFYYNHWTPENPSNTLGYYADRNASALLSSDYYVEDASYLRLKSISLGYNLPSKIVQDLKLKKARIFVTGNNLYTWTKYSGYDPEVNSGSILLSGFDRISYPRARTILFGLNVTF